MTYKRIWLSPPHMSGEEMKYIKEAFETNWIAPLGPNVNGFEKDLEDYIGNGVNATVLSSGTAAIHLALVMLGVKHGDEVLCSTFTFCGSAFPIKYQGAKPIFIDSENETWNIDPNLLEEAIKDRIDKGIRPKAVIVVHLYGMPAKMEQIVEICRKYNVPLIEDAAEALGSKYNGRRLGSFGDIGVFSFNGNKILNTSGGGALVSKNKDYTEKAKFLSTQARDMAPYYQHSEIGFNYRMSNIIAGLGRGQMEVVNERIQQRRSNFDFYHKNLNKISGVSFLEEPDGAYSNYWLTTILIDPIKTRGITSENIRLILDKYNIESRPLWKPMHLQPVFQNELSYLNGISESLFNTGLCLPSGSSLSEEDRESVLALILRNLK